MYIIINMSGIIRRHSIFLHINNKYSIKLYPILIIFKYTIIKNNEYDISIIPNNNKNILLIIINYIYILELLLYNVIGDKNGINKIYRIRISTRIN